MIPDGADIEIIERTHAGHNGTGIVIPNTVRINGDLIAMPDDATIAIDDITNSAAVRVTLTLFARSIRIAAEPENPG